MAQLENSKKLQQFNVYSEEVREVLSTPPSSLYFWGTTIVTSVVGVLLFVSYLVKFPDVLKSEAVITTQKAPLTLLAKSNGILKHVYVEDNEIVEPKTLLAEISSNIENQDIDILDQFITTFQDKYKGQKISFPEGLQIGEFAIDYAALKTAYNIYYNAKKHLPEAKTIAKIEKQLSVYYDLRDNLDTQAQLRDEQLSLSQKNLARQKALLDDGIIALSEFETNKQTLLEGKRSKETSNYQLLDLELSITDLERQIQILTNTETVNFLGYDNQIIELCNSLNARIKIWKEAHLIIAPFSGTISYLSYLQENQHVKNEQKLFALSPDSSALIVRGNLPIIKSGKVKKGQKVIIRVPAYPEQEYGFLNGRVENISLMQVEKGYMVDISLENGLETTYGIALAYKPNMQVNAEIITEDIRLIERIFYEIRAIFVQ